MKSFEAMWSLLIGILWVVTFLTFPDRLNGFWQPKAVAWLTGSFLLASSVWWNPPRASGLSNPWVGVLFAWVAILFCWRSFVPQLVLPNTLQAIVGIPWNVFIILPSLSCLGSLLAMDAIIRHAKALSHWIRLAEALCWLAVVLAGYGLLQILGLDPWQLGNRAVLGYMQRNDPLTTFGNYSLTANFLAICAPLCLVFRPRRFLLAYGLLSTIILWTHSAASIIAWAISSLLACCWLHRWRLLSGLLTGLVGGCWLILHQGLWLGFLNPHGRLSAWASAWHLWSSQPALLQWTGIGLGSVERLETFRFWTWGSLHNEPLQILFETGIVGATLSLLAIGWTLWRVCWSPKPAILRAWGACAVSFAMIACVSFPLRLAPMLAVGVCIWAALESLSEGGRYAPQG